MLLILACAEEEVAPTLPQIFSQCSHPKRDHFEDIAQDWGLSDTTAPLSSLPRTTAPVGVADLNEDGLDDLVIGRMDGFAVQLNQNLSFDEHFLLSGSTASSVSIADINGDYHLDLLLAAFNGTVDYLYLFLNDGHANFPENPLQLSGAFFGDIRSMDLADIDHDRDLDLYIADSLGSRLFINDGRGTFSERLLEAPDDANGHFWLSAFLDLEHDPWPDLFLAADRQELGPPRLFQNQQGQLISLPAFATVNAMGGSLLDYNQDGTEDIFISGTGGDGLYANMGDNTFIDVTAAAQTAGSHTIGQMTLGSVATDYDNDGWVDIFTASGRIGEDDLWQTQDAVEPDALYHNHATLFEDEALLFAYGDNADGGSVSTGDFDGDGRPDLLLGQAAAPSHLYLSPDSSACGLDVQLIGHQSNSFGIGARLVLHTSTGDLSAWMHVLAGLGASQPPRVHFGLGDAVPQSLTVWWPMGTHQEVPLDADTRVLVVEE